MEESPLITVIKTTVFVSSPALQCLAVLVYYLESSHGTLWKENVRPTVQTAGMPVTGQVSVVKTSDQAIGFLYL